MTTQFQQFEQLTDALESGNYSRMAKAAKAVGIFEGKAPNKGDLTSKIQDWLDANVSIDAAPVVPEPVADMLLGAVGERDSVPFPVPDNVDNTPQPTGYIGGQAEFYYWPGEKVYAQNVSGQAIEPKFDPAMWETMKAVLPKAEALKTTVVKSAKKAAEATKYTYTVTVTLNRTITFESIDDDLGATDLTIETLNQLLVDNGQSELTCFDYGFNVVKGKTKKSGSRSTSGQCQGSGFYAASNKSELRPLNTIQKQILQAAASVDGCPLSDYAKYGRQDSVKLGNVCIDFKKKGYGDAIRRQNGAIVFDSGAMYPGYTLADSGI